MILNWGEDHDHRQVDLTAPARTGWLDPGGSLETTPGGMEDTSMGDSMPEKNEPFVAWLNLADADIPSD